MPRGRQHQPHHSRLPQARTRLIRWASISTSTLLTVGLEKHDFHVPPNLAAGQIVTELAAAKRVAPSAIVLAYLWSRPFPVIPIIGSRTIAQLEDGVAALPVRLTPTELAALETTSQSGLPAS